MYMRKISVIIFIYSISVPLTLLLSCKPKDKGDFIEENITRIEVNPKENYKLTHENFEILSVTPMEDHPDGTVGKVGGVSYHNGHFYLIDTQQKAIFTFDSLGVFVRKFQNKGKGPGEYSSMHRVTTANYNNSRAIAIWDINRKAMLFYSYEGIFLGEHKFPFWALDVVMLNDDFAVYFGERAESGISNNIYVVDGNNEVKNRYFPRFSRRQIDLRKSVFSRYKNTYNFTFAESNIIYNLSTNGLKSRYQIDFGPMGLAENERVITQRNLPAFISKDKAWHISNIKESDSLLFFHYIMDGTLHYGLHLKNNKQTISGIANIENEIISLEFPNGFNSNDGIFLRSINMSELLRHYKSNESSFNFVDSLIENHKDNQNPIVIMYKIKTK